MGSHDGMHGHNWISFFIVRSKAQSTQQVQSGGELYTASKAEQVYNES